MAVNLSPVAGAAAQFFDNSGNVLTGGKLYTYDAGTTTPAPTYTTSAGTVSHPNPIVLNAAGRVPDSGEIWLADSISYKFVLKDQNDVLIGTYDNLIGINSNFVNFTGEEETQIATQGQTVFTLVDVQYQPATNNLLVFVNGSKQVPVENFTETSSTTVTFVDGLNVGDVVDFCTATPINTFSVDAANVSYNEGGTGAVDRNVEQKLQEIVSVKDFGAVGDGVTDDTEAIQLAVDDAGCVYFPEGTYLITDTITISNKSIEIYGAGRDVTILNFDSGVNEGFIFDSSASFSVFGLKDFTLATSNSLGGTAFQAIWPYSFDSRNVMKAVVENVQIRGFSEYTTGWAYGFDFTQGINVFFTNCGFEGKDQGGPSSSAQADKTLSQKAILWQGTTYPVELKLIGCVFNCWDTGVAYNGYGEGLYVIGTTFGQVRIGLNIVIDVAGRYRPGLFVADSHIDCYQAAIYNDGMIQGTIHDCLFYANSTGTQSAILLSMLHTGGIDIHDNQFYTFNTTHIATAIAVDESNRDYIHHNIFGEGNWNSAIYFLSGAQNCLYTDNQYLGTSYISGAVFQGGTNNLPNKNTFAYLTNDYSIANNTLTLLNWDNVLYDYLGFIASTPGNLFTVPKGVQRIKVTVGLSFAGNTTGVRGVEIQKNGSSSYLGSGYQYVNAIAGTTAVNTAVNISTGELVVGAGDTIRVAVNQTSGGALNANGSGNSWVLIEVLG